MLNPVIIASNFHHFTLSKNLYFVLIISFCIVFILICQRGNRGLLGTPFMYLFIYMISKMAILLRYCQSVTLCICKHDTCARVICHLQTFDLVNWYIGNIGRFKCVFTCFFCGLSCSSLFYFAITWVQSMNLRQLTILANLLSIVLIYIKSINCYVCVTRQRLL